jgi:hypothetical protein
MNRATPPMREFAARLIAHEAGERSAGFGTSAAFAVCDRMRAPIATLMGNGGHRALLMRALVLAAAEAPWLQCLQVAIDGSLEAETPSLEALGPNHAREGGIVLVAQLIGLLVAFIGERLTLQLVHEVWPKLPAGELNFKI